MSKPACFWSRCPAAPTGVARLTDVWACPSGSDLPRLARRRWHFREFPVMAACAPSREPWSPPVWVLWACPDASRLPCTHSGRTQQHTIQGSALQPALARLPGSNLSDAPGDWGQPCLETPQAAQSTQAWKRSLFPARLWGLPVGRRGLSTDPGLKHGPRGRGEPTGLTWFRCGFCASL